MNTSPEGKQVPTLAEHRKKRHLTQEQFAELIGIPRGTLARYEAGAMPSIRRAEQIVARLNVRPWNITWGNPTDDDVSGNQHG